MSRHIDADELIEFFDGYPDHVEFDVEDIKSIINEQDTADVRENVHGKWIVWGGMDIPENHGRHKCSECGEFALLRYEQPLRKEVLSDFCPNCGSDMRTAKQIIHDAINNTPMAEDVYVGIKEKLHKAVDECIVGDIYENKNR